MSSNSSKRERVLAALILIIAGASCIYAFTRIVPLALEHGQIAPIAHVGAQAH